MTTAAVIVAAGRGLRAGGDVRSSGAALAGRAVVAWTLEAFRTSPVVQRIALVLHPDDAAMAPGYEAHPDVIVAVGGATRARACARGSRR